jgi:hypothetical protein
MVLNAHSSFPQTLTYVVKLHHDASLRDGHLIGRLEHLASGHQFHFNSAEELIACLIGDALRAQTSSSEELS